MGEGNEETCDRDGNIALIRRSMRKHVGEKLFAECCLLIKVAIKRFFIQLSRYSIDF